MAVRVSYPKISAVRWHDGHPTGDAPSPRGQVVAIDTTTALDIDPDRVLASAIGRLSDVVVIGWDKSGEMYVASSHADGGNLLWLLEAAKAELFKVAMRMNDEGAV